MKKILIGLVVALTGTASGLAIAYTTGFGINGTICKPGTDHCFQCVESGGQQWCRHCEGTKCSTWLPVETGPSDPGGA